MELSVFSRKPLCLKHSCAASVIEWTHSIYSSACGVQSYLRKVKHWDRTINYIEGFSRRRLRLPNTTQILSSYLVEKSPLIMSTFAGWMEEVFKFSVEETTNCYICSVVIRLFFISSICNLLTVVASGLICIISSIIIYAFLPLDFMFYSFSTFGTSHQKNGHLNKR